MNCTTQSNPEIKRVSSSINQSIIDFCKDKMVSSAGIFTMNELERTINERTGCALGSAGRILRNMNRLGVISYYCSDRSKSIYVVHQVLDK